MKTCNWYARIEAMVDGECGDSALVEAHLATCSKCVTHRDNLLQWRAALAPAMAHPELSDQQFPVFMEGIRAGISETRPRSGGIWALVSLAAASLIIAIATFSIFTGPGPVVANEVESAHTDIDGATISVENPKGGVTTIWISTSKDDILP